MASIAPAPYRPERVSPPGNTIRDILDDIGMSQAELARRMGRPPNKINQIIQGKKAITADTALELESVLGLPASFWMNREQNYQLALSQLEQLEEQEQACEIAKDFLCAQMARLGWIEKKTSWLEKYQQLLRFFASAKLNALNAAVELAPSFRNSDGKNACQKALAAWLRKGVLESQKIHAAEFCKERARQHLESFRELTRGGPAALTDELPKVAAGLGIAVVFVPHLKGTYVGGAAFWHGETPIIQLSFRGKRHDVLWFNFFHELGHILLHSRNESFLDDFSADQDHHEVEANRFAADTLIPQLAWEQFCVSGNFTAAAVQRFGKAIGISESIVVGRLKKEGFVPHAKLQKSHITVSC
jgi:HTH-type transcriptional regulator/antitoxin HigA